MSTNEMFEVLSDNSIGCSPLDPNMSQLHIDSLQLLNLLPQCLNLPLLIQIHQTPMIDFMLNNLSLSLKDRAGILMIRNLGRANLAKVTTDWIRDKVEGIALSMMSLVMEHSQGLDPWTDRSKGLIQTMPRS